MKALRSDQLPSGSKPSTTSSPSPASTRAASRSTSCGSGANSSVCGRSITSTLSACSASAAGSDTSAAPSTGRPDRVYHIPSGPLLAQIGEKRFDHLAEGVVDLSRIDFANENAVYLTDGRALDEARRLGIPITTL